MYKNIKYEINEGLAAVTVNRPEALNALNMDVLDELYDVFDKIASDDEVRAVIVTGEVRSFVADTPCRVFSSLPSSAA